MLELFLIILTFKRQKVGGEKIVSIRYADIAGKKEMSCQADKFLYALQ